METKDYIDEDLLTPAEKKMLRNVEDIEECLTKLRELESTKAKDISEELEKIDNKDWRGTNKELQSPRKTYTNDANRHLENEQDLCKATDEYSIPLSPSCTNMSGSSFTTLSESIYGEISSSNIKAQKAKSDGAISNLRKKCYASKSKSAGPSPTSKSIYTLPKGKSSSREGKAESIYNLRCFIRNPITGQVTQVAASTPKPNVPTVNREKETSEKAFAPSEVNIVKDATGNNYNDLTLLSSIKPQPQVRRNPITGEGMPHNPAAINFLRSGIRINQPPGGLSSGIF